MADSLLFSWLLAPLAMALVFLGCGLLLRRTAADTVPGALVLPLGFALVLVVSGLMTSFELTAGWAAAVFVPLALIGMFVGRGDLAALGRRRRAALWPALAALVAFTVVAAPLVLSGSPTFTGYTRIVDIAYQWELSDHLVNEGRSQIADADSSHTYQVSKLLTAGYPGAWQATLGSFGRLFATDLAWIYQPLLALTSAVLALGLFGLLRGLVRSVRLRALAAAVAAQANVLYSYALAGGLKELAAAAVLVLTAGLIRAVADAREPGLRDSLPLGVALGACAASFSLAIAPWLGVLVVGGVLVTVARSSHRRRTLAVWGAAALLAGVLILPAFAQVSQLAGLAADAEGANRTAVADLGNLEEPVPVEAAAGVWITADHRFPRLTEQPLTGVLIAAALGLAALGVAHALRRREFVPAVLAASALIALAYYELRTGPWIRFKAIAISGPVVLALAFAGAASIASLGRWRRAVGWALGAALAVAVLAGNALAYRNASIAPSDRMRELEQLGERIAGQGPTLFLSFDEMGEYFLRKGKAVGLVNQPPDWAVDRTVRVKASSVGLDIDELPASLRPAVSHSGGPPRAVDQPSPVELQAGHAGPPLRDLAARAAGGHRAGPRARGGQPQLRLGVEARRRRPGRREARLRRASATGGVAAEPRLPQALRGLGHRRPAGHAGGRGSRSQRGHHRGEAAGPLRSLDGRFVRPALRGAAGEQAAAGACEPPQLSGAVRAGRLGGSAAEDLPAAGATRGRLACPGHRLPRARARRAAGSGGQGSSQRPHPACGSRPCRVDMSLEPQAGLARAGPKMKVAIGPADPAGVGSALAAGLVAGGHEATTVMWLESPWGYRADRLVGTRAGALRFALAGSRRFEVLHVLGGRSWAFYGDLLLARAEGRTGLVQYNGSDCRTSDIAARLHPARARVVDPGRDREIRLHRRLAARAARAAVVQDLELVDYLRNDFARIYVAPFAIDAVAVERAQAASSEADGGPLRVVHAPSERRIKGSDEIEAAIRGSGLDVRFETVTGRPHHEALTAMARADVIVDQLNAETPGVLSAEAMALGKPVLCEHDPAKLAEFARPCPVVAITAATLADELGQLAADPGRRHSLGEAGRRYARATHHPDVAAAAMVAVYRHAPDAGRGLYEASPAGVRALD